MPRNTYAVVVDLETVPIEGVEAFVDPVVAPSNYKDPKKIADFERDKQAEQIAKAALDPATCRIVALGWWREDVPEPTVYSLNAEHNERQGLMDLWHHIDHGALITFNGKSFDLPVLHFRSLILGVPHRALEFSKYRNAREIDLAMLLTAQGATRLHSLSWYCRRFEIAPETDDAGIDGSQIGALYQAGDLDAIARHCRADVERTAGLAAKLRVWRRRA